MTFIPRIALPIGSRNAAGLPRRGAPAQTFYARPEKRRVEAIVKDYLIAILRSCRTVMAALDKHQQDDAAQKVRATILKDNRHPVQTRRTRWCWANPHGSVTLVEFFDYNCGLLQAPLPDMMKLLQTDSNIKFVLKEFPVLGDGSSRPRTSRWLRACRTRPASSTSNPSGSCWAAAGAVRSGAALAVAKEVGFDMRGCSRTMNSPEIKDHDRRGHDAGRRPGRERHASYDGRRQLVVGAVGFDDLQQKIQAIEKK